MEDRKRCGGRGREGDRKGWQGGWERGLTNVNRGVHSVQSVLVQSLHRLGFQGERGMDRDTRNDSAEIFFRSFLREATDSTSSKCRDVHTFDVVHPAFPLQTAALPVLQVP